MHRIAHIGESTSDCSASHQVLSFDGRYLAEAISSFSEPELLGLANDINTFEGTGGWTNRLSDVMQRAVCLADADAMLLRLRDS